VQRAAAKRQRWRRCSTWTQTMTQGNSFEIFHNFRETRRQRHKSKSQLATCDLQPLAATSLTPNSLSKLLKKNAKLQLHQVQICKSSGLQVFGHVLLDRQNLLKLQPATRNSQLATWHIYLPLGICFIVPAEISFHWRDIMP